MKTLAEARKDFQKVIHEDGGRCPCCRRWGKINGYQITSTQARGMIWMLKNFSKATWVDLRKAPKWILRSKAMATLHHWGLLEAQPKDTDPTKRGLGLWRLTPQGRDFVHRRTTVPKHAFVFDNKLIKFSKEQVDVVQALGENFSYEELMNTTFKGVK